MSKIIPINEMALTPAILISQLPLQDITDIHVIYQTKDGCKQSRSSCESWGIWMEMYAMMQFEAMEHVRRMKEISNDRR